MKPVRPPQVVSVTERGERAPHSDRGTIATMLLLPSAAGRGARGRTGAREIVRTNRAPAFIQRNVKN
ncbi:hypothetical protein GCM10027440_28960 [Nocardiopsis coralliicola]